MNYICNGVDSCSECHHLCTVSTREGDGSTGESGTSTGILDY